MGYCRQVLSEDKRHPSLAGFRAHASSSFMEEPCCSYICLHFVQDGISQPIKVPPTHDVLHNGTGGGLHHAGASAAVCNSLCTFRMLSPICELHVRFSRIHHDNVPASSSSIDGKCMRTTVQECSLQSRGTASIRSPCIATPSARSQDPSLQLWPTACGLHVEHVHVDGHVVRQLHNYVR